MVHSLVLKISLPLPEVAVGCRRRILHIHTRLLLKTYSECKETVFIYFLTQKKMMKKGVAIDD